MEFYSGDFQCPDTGWGVYLIFDEEKGIIKADVCNTGIWDTEECDPETLEDTQSWCKKFGQKPCDTLEEAREIAEKYDTFFS